ncbi:hypothetical protein [Gallaecimonas pentaromativorans]|uniref:hypothetical protein n=1 Tax=Gallaecimonas pentaromativorans TaxID=584787 RepID=UPI003A8FD803
MKKGTFFIIVVAVTLLNGCSTIEREYQQKSLLSNVDCLIDTHKIKYEELSAVTNVEINEHSPCMEFNGDKSYFAAFRVPKGENLIIFSKVYWPRTYFKPVIDFVDSDFNTIQHLFPEQTYQGSNILISKEEEMKSNVAIPEKTTYLLIYTRKSFTEKYDTVITVPAHTESIKEGLTYRQQWVPKQNRYINREFTGKLTISIK